MASCLVIRFTCRISEILMIDCFRVGLEWSRWGQGTRRGSAPAIQGQRLLHDAHRRGLQLVPGESHRTRAPLRFLHSPLLLRLQRRALCAAAGTATRWCAASEALGRQLRPTDRLHVNSQFQEAL